MSSQCITRRALFVALGLASAHLQAQLGPSNSDLWDTSRGSMVSATTTLYPSSNADDMFGAVTNGTVEPGNLLFQDGQPAGFVHAVEWSTPGDVTVSSMVLSIAHDGPNFDANRRGISQFRLYAKNPQTGAFDFHLAEYQPGSPYGDGPQPADGFAEFNAFGNEMFLCMKFSAVTAREFRAEFTQFGNGSFTGPRIFELDGYAEPNCAQFKINTGLNDAWFNPDTNGQGFFIIVFPDIPLMFLAWFTYDTERPDDSVQASLGDSGHRWITAQGPSTGIPPCWTWS